MLYSVTLTVDIFPAHIEDHGRASAVLNSSVATKLNEIRNAQHRGDVVSRLLDLLHLLHGEAHLFRLCNSELVLERDSRHWSSETHQIV